MSKFNPTIQEYPDGTSLSLANVAVAGVVGAIIGAAPIVAMTWWENRQIRKAVQDRRQSAQEITEILETDN